MAPVIPATQRRGGGLSLSPIGHMPQTVLHCLHDHRTGRLSSDLAKLGKANACGRKLGAVSWAMAWTGRVLRRFEDVRPDCIAVHCSGCKRWTEYRRVADMKAA